MQEISGVWRTRGFEAFRRGTFGNAGQNLYVSRAGVLQRIHLFDLNKDGYLDLIFCNAQEHLESPPVYVYRDILGNPQCTELPSSGSSNGAVADLNFDGYDDLLLGMEKSGNAGMRNAYIYYGSPEGLSERNLIRVPAHRCTASAIGDFNGDGRHDVALITEDKLRIFYQSECGFEPMVFVDFDIGFDQIGAAGLDRDGYSDLVAFSEDGPPRIYWGGPDGIDLERRSDVLIGDGADGRIEEEQMAVSEEEGVSGAISIACSQAVLHFFE